MSSDMMSLLPQWLRITWAVAFAGVALTHLWHVWFLRGQPRWWHIGHTLMALGMLLMYLGDRMAHPTWYWAGAAVFGALALASVATAEVMRRRGGTLNPLWMVSALDQVIMLYMLLPGTLRFAAATYLFVTYLVGQVVAWALGVWGQVPATRPAPIPASCGTQSGSVLIHPSEPGAAHPAGGPGRTLDLSAHCTPATRMSLAVMAAGMGYMLAVM